MKVMCRNMVGSHNATVLSDNAQDQIYRAADYVCLDYSTMSLCLAHLKSLQKQKPHERKGVQVPNVERCIGFGEVTTTAGPRQGRLVRFDVLSYLLCYVVFSRESLHSSRIQIPMP